MAGNRGMHQHDQGLAGEPRDRRDVAQEVERELVGERAVDRIGGADQEQRVAVGGRADDRRGRDIAGVARQVLDHEGCPEPFREPLADQARQDVVRAAGRKPDEQAHRPRRIGLRVRDAGHGRQSGGAGG